MRYKVVIADDNPLIRESLKKTVKWEQLQCEIVGEAQDGKQEQRLIGKIHPDIVISDIKMPGMDGLEVTEYVKETGCSAKIIIITGYNEFQYAHKALKLGVFDFILKPIDNRELERIIRNAVNKLAQEREDKVKLEDARRLLNRQSLLDWVCGIISLSGQELKEYMENEGFKGKKFIYVIAKYRGLEEERSGRVFSAMEEEIDRKNEGIREYRPYLYLGTKDGRSAEILCVQQKNISASMGNITIKKFLDELYYNLYRMEGIEVCFAVSNQSEDLHNLPDMRKQALKVLEAGFFTAKERVLFFHHYSWPEFMEPEGIVQELEEFYRMLDSNNMENTKEKVEMLLAEIEISAKGNEFQIKCWLSEICMTLYRHFYNGKLLQGEYERNVGDVLNEINALSDMKQARSYLEDFIAALYRMMEHYHSYHNPLVQDSLTYIKANYSDAGLSLTNVADSLNINASYLSRLLKKETDRNFSDILTGIRINKAKQLLMEPDSKAAEVGCRCGYRDYSYFYQVFKKSEGMAPTEWKKVKRTNKM